jgi:hypothetical protein
MLVTVLPSVKQLKRYAQSALNGFETLSTDDAIENAKCEIEEILTYLSTFDTADDAFTEFFVKGIEGGIKLEMRFRDAN